MDTRRPSGEALRRALGEGILQRWYPLVVDREMGGYFTNLGSGWEVLPAQEKMIVTQARHVWTLSKAAGFLAGTCDYEELARQGARFLKERMWDAEHGGFFQIRARDGGPTDSHGWRDEKRTYGNAFGIYCLASLYELTGDAEILEFAKEAFDWLETHAFDSELGGYFQFLTREGRPFGRGDGYRTMAGDAVEVGYKDQNSSIHMLEAYTELYRVWKDPRLKKQLTALLFLIRDRMVHSKGYLQLFFEPDFRPVSFRHFPAKMRDENFGLDHVSFGHDYETAFLMLEASHALGMERDERTLEVGKRMLDHALQFGWDEETGGFCDAGYYFTKDGPCTIVRRTKNWWAQAEGLNVLALFSRIFPGESRYRECLQRQWDYIDRCVIDHDRGDWFEGGIDHEPRFRTGPKSHIWKCTYHTSRALMNCLALFGDKDLPGMGERFDSRVREMEALVGELKRSANR